MPFMVRNWDKWQTYRKDRGTPPWIKLHRCVMRDPDWVALTDAQRGQLTCMWLLAADRGGELPEDPVLIQKLCCMESRPDLEFFETRGFIKLRRHAGVNVTPLRRQLVTPESDTE